MTPTTPFNACIHPTSCTITINIHVFITQHTFSYPTHPIHDLHNQDDKKCLKRKATMNDEEIYNT